jgi:hypothetical protein
MSDTTYIVLTEMYDNEGVRDGWHTMQTIEAGRAADAIRKTITDGGTYVAVPARSWKPVTVTTETKTVLKLEQPTSEPA